MGRSYSKSIFKTRKVTIIYIYTLKIIIVGVDNDFTGSSTSLEVWHDLDLVVQLEDFALLLPSYSVHWVNNG